jgi:hypothetical protein
MSELEIIPTSDEELGTPVPAAVPEVDPEVDPENDEEGEDAPFVQGEAGFDPTSVGAAPDAYITIRTSSGGSRYIPATEAMTVRNLVSASGLAIQGAYDVYMDQNIVQQDTLVPVGATVTLIGNVKGA